MSCNVKYTGCLGKKRKAAYDNSDIAKIIKIAFPEIASELEQERNETDEKYTQEIMEELCKHYMVDKGDWYILALQLAQDHVPALQIDQRSIKRTPKVPLYEDLRIIGAVEGFRKHGKVKSVSKACRFVAKDLHEVWGDDAEQIKQKYRDACQRQFGKKSFPDSFNISWEQFLIAAQNIENALK